MSGIYIHIPFCKSRCVYCGFYSTTSLDLRHSYVDAICRELELRSDYLGEPVSTVYFGGGTPSVLSVDDLDRIFNAVYKYNKVYGNSDGVAEFTIECNPDDITDEFCSFLSSSPVNRISMGVQSFSDGLLKFARRRHGSSQPKLAVERLRHIGIPNISIDLMFGFPNESLEVWRNDIDKALSLDVEHISAYSLMFEEGTCLYGMLQRGEVKECDEETSLAMFNMLIDKLEAAGYEHYEISNFAKPGFRSQHNSSYWHGVPYLGLGASAHSFNGSTRQWNIGDVRKYIDSISCGNIPAEIEVLTKDNSYDDMIMTGLRTVEGVSLDEVERRFGKDYLDFLEREALRYVKAKLLKYSVDHRSLSLTRKGLFVSDSVMCDLMHV